MNIDLLDALLTGLVAVPALACCLLALPAWFGHRFRESTIVSIVGTAFAATTLSAAVLVVMLLARGETEIGAHLGDWFAFGHDRFALVLLGDRLSLPFALFSAALVGLIAAFSRRYMHQEAGFYRFYLLLCLFGLGVEIVVLAGSLDLIFLGWELVGLTSALLIAFFHERPKPVEHGLRAFLTYRVCDVGLLGAAAWLHHEVGTARLVEGDALAPWDGLPVPSDAVATAVVGLLLLWATMGKSAQVPLSGWLPRAMEGPTPSSAIFYGAISIHLGPYLLLRAAPILDASPLTAWLVVAVGTATALHGNFVGRVQTDIKSVLSYASMTQVGLIFVEIGLGLRYVALAHIVGHAALRSLEILRSPNLLHDHQHLEKAIGSTLPRTGLHLERLVPRRLQPWLYRHALERGAFDALLRDRVVGTWSRLLGGVDRLDRAWTRRLAGPPPAPTTPPTEPPIDLQEANR